MNAADWIILVVILLSVVQAASSGFFKEAFGIAGLVIGMLQAATQINESTLSFIPKLLLLVLTLFAAGPWILRVLIDFTRDLYASIPSMIG